MSVTGIILFGDSVFFGYGASKRRNSCGYILKSLLNVPILIKSRNQDSTIDGLKRLKKDVLEKENYSHVIIFFGNNDCRLIARDKALVDCNKYKDNLRKMVNKIRKARKIPLISNLQPIDSDGFFRCYPEIKKFVSMRITPKNWQKRYSDICEETAKIEGIPLVNIRTILAEKKKEIQAPDGLHPNDLGHKIIAKTIFCVLDKLRS